VRTTYYLMEPYTRDPQRRYQDATVWSEHHTAAAACAALDVFAERMKALRIQPESSELYVVDQDRRPVARPGVEEAHDGHATD